MPPRPIAPGLFETSADGPRLRAARCAACGKLHFPATPTCPVLRKRDHDCRLWSDPRATCVSSRWSPAGRRAIAVRCPTASASSSSTARTSRSSRASPSPISTRLRPGLPVTLVDRAALHRRRRHAGGLVRLRTGLGVMRPVYVAGVGLHPFGRFADRGLTALGVDAVRAALARRRRRARRLPGRVLRHGLRRRRHRPQGAHRARPLGRADRQRRGGLRQRRRGALARRRPGRERPARHGARLRRREDAARHDPLELLRAVARGGRPGRHAGVLRAARAAADARERRDGARPRRGLGEEPPPRRAQSVRDVPQGAVARRGPRLGGRVRAAAPPHAVLAQRGRRRGRGLGARRTARPPVRIAAAVAALAPRRIGARRAHAARRRSPSDARRHADRDGGAGRVRGRRASVRRTSTSPRCRTPMRRARSSPPRSWASARRMAAAAGCATAAARWARGCR